MAFSVSLNLYSPNTFEDFIRFRASAEQAIGIRARLLVFRRTQLRRGDPIVKSHEEHGEILRQMARGDGGEAARCMRAHMLNASGAPTSYIKMFNDSDPPA